MVISDSTSTYQPKNLIFDHKRSRKCFIISNQTKTESKYTRNEAELYLQPTFLTFLILKSFRSSSFSLNNVSISLSDVCFKRSTSNSSLCKFLKYIIPKISVSPEQRKSQKLNFIIELTRCGFEIQSIRRAGPHHNLRTRRLHPSLGTTLMPEALYFLNLFENPIILRILS